MRRIRDGPICICSTPPNEELSFTNSSPLYDASVMGNCQGPLSISYSNYAFSFASWATKGLRALGIQPIGGLLSGSLLGQSYLISTINVTTMTRDSSETSTQRPRGGNGSGPSGRSARRRERQVPRRLPAHQQRLAMLQLGT
ncbi:hypothetical protein PENPOL_c006G02834 [Penicillium polonicum]|uniref:Uncharacterized protein n=1 Tax=Penicillium polonicum TaxID=60169 RepID=A0A1V6NKG5_PENPO|nr:hypothetical protein PENPOL_c006G02834 [Penicillium polonicum]